MNYTNYEKAIVENHKVKIVGWTYSRLISPSEIGTVDDIRALRDALKMGACKWVRLSKRELATHIEDIARRRSDGEVIGKKRKERSDKGKKRKRRSGGREDDEDDQASEENTEANGVVGPSKRKKVAKAKDKQRMGARRSQIPPMQGPKSKSVISDSETDASESGGGE
jgi:hypothetical protein